ncbi:MAG: thiosulfate/3-mercaptopyruvate sulfurtransferase [Gaiellaceae bacterium]|jgi:thiosulfate/3-mercaptopyruvate sulfurtransferase|nr:thiosulfate/3-mercaptopyruvate sulfurtransferase [Gaiellaceae bacterium]
MSLPPLVDAAWVREHLGEEGLVLGDVRGPNAHQRGHLPGSIPLVLGSPPPLATRETVREFAVEVQRRLGRHGVTGAERLVLYDRGDCVGAASSAQAALLAGHPHVSVLAGGVAGWPEELEQGAVELQKTKTTLELDLQAVPTWEELRDRLDDPSLTLLDVRTEDEYRGRSGYPCDPRQGHIPGARLLEVERLFAGPGRPHEAAGLRDLLGLPDGAEIVVYCHSGSRSALGALALRAARYDARNYPGSWHEWSRHEDLPLER